MILLISDPCSEERFVVRHLTVRIWDGSSLSHPRHPGFESQVEFRPSRLGHNGAQRTKLDPPQKETEREIKDGRSEKESRAPKRAKKRGIAKEK